MRKIEKSNWRDRPNWKWNLVSCSLCVDPFINARPLHERIISAIQSFLREYLSMYIIIMSSCLEIGKIPTIEDNIFLNRHELHLCMMLYTFWSKGLPNYFEKNQIFFAVQRKMFIIRQHYLRWFHITEAWWIVASIKVGLHLGNMEIKFLVFYARYPSISSSLGTYAWMLTRYCVKLIGSIYYPRKKKPTSHC